CMTIVGASLDEASRPWEERVPGAVVAAPVRQKLPGVQEKVKGEPEVPGYGIPNVASTPDIVRSWKCDRRRPSDSGTGGDGTGSYASMVTVSGFEG
ncbi:MAG: hypothetical protein ACRCZF_21280, partial [Gemmataceae bacterium]